MGGQGIHDAASGGDLVAVRRLITAGESPDTPWINGLNALPYLLISRAPSADRLAVASFLLAGDHLFCAPIATGQAMRSYPVMRCH